MSWWQILMLVVGFVWSCYSSIGLVLAVVFNGFFNATRASTADWVLLSLLWAIGPALVIAAVAT